MPLEKTLYRHGTLAWAHLGDSIAKGVKIEHVHQQARLAAGTVADNDEFPTELGHRRWSNWQALMQGQVSEGCGDGRRVKWFVLGKKLRKTDASCSGRCEGASLGGGALAVACDQERTDDWAL